MLLQGKAFRKRIKYEFLKAFMRFTLYGDFFIFLLYLFPFFFTLTQIRIIIYLIKPEVDLAGRQMYRRISFLHL